jgi:hypothetical protein
MEKSQDCKLERYRCAIVTSIGKYASIEFDLARHPNQLPLIVTPNQLRHEKIDSDALPIDGLARAEIQFS